VLNQILLPKSSWVVLIDALIQIKLGQAHDLNSEDMLFLQQLKYLDENSNLTDIGNNVCRFEYVTRDTKSADAIHHDAVLALPVTQAILQSLWGTDNIDVTHVNNALVFIGADSSIVDKRLTNLLQILNRHNILVYGRKNRSIKLLAAPIKPTATQAPEHIYIDRSRPFANDFYIREIIREARGKLMWLDKYFQKEGLEWLWREVDAANITVIQIVSSLGDEPLDATTLADYKRFKKELEAKGVAVEWRTLARSKSHDFHDRWILDDNGLCYNLPSINSIKSGQKSELHKSPNGDTITGIFNDYFSAATPVK